MTGADPYLSARVTTAPPERLHAMVVDGAVRWATRAADALDIGDREAGHLAASKGLGLVSELIAGLNREVDADLADRTAALFAFAFARLAEADRTGTPGPARDAARVLSAHRETWAELLAARGSGTDRTATPDAAGSPVAAGLDLAA